MFVVQINHKIARVRPARATFERKGKAFYVRFLDERRIQDHRVQASDVFDTEEAATLELQKRILRDIEDARTKLEATKKRHSLELEVAEKSLKASLDRSTKYYSASSIATTSDTDNLPQVPKNDLNGLSLATSEVLEKIADLGTECEDGWVDLTSVVLMFDFSVMDQIEVLTDHDLIDLHCNGDEPEMVRIKR